MDQGLQRRLPPQRHLVHLPGPGLGRPVPEDTDPRRFVVFGSNHDQIGNRAVGDRPSAGLDDAALAATAALVLLSPYTPMLFMGEEWGTRTPFQFFTDHEEEDLARSVSQGRAREFAGFGWDATRSPTPRTPRPSRPRAWTGPSLSRPSTPACWPGTGH